MRKMLPLFLLLLVFHSLHAADPIYAINYFDGLSYNNNIVTPSTSTIYLLSDSVNVITAKETSLYYWPLTSEYKADWATTNKTLNGRVVITSKQGEELIIEAQPYVIQYDANNMRDTIKLYWNDEAQNAHKEFAYLQDSYIDALYEYRIAEQEYSKQVDAFFMNMDENNDSTSFPVAPIPPPSFSLLSTEIHYGYPLELQEGSYTISFMREDGEIVDELTKKIVSFAPISLDTGYKVFEENKWTVPSFFPDSHNTLYTTSNAKLYAEPQQFSQYESKKYNLLINPQDSFYTQDDYYIWKTHGYNDESILSLLDSSIPIKGYKVVQIAGSKLGYEMREMPINQVGNSFNAALLDVNTLEEKKSYRVGSTSQIVLLRLFPSLPFLMIALAVLPIIGFILSAFIKIIQKRGKRMNFIPDLSQGQAVILALTAAAMWGTWFISLKHLNGFPVAAFYLELFITSFILVWSVGLLIDGRLIFTEIQRVFELRPSKILLVYGCGIGYVVGMSLSIKVMTMIGLTLSQPLQSTISLVIGTIVTTTVGGIPENLRIINLVMAVIFLFGSIMFVTLAQRGVAKAKKELESLSDLAKDPHIMRKAIILILFASAFIPAYTLGLSYGLKTITQDVGLAPLPYMCVIVTGALTGAIITSGITLTRKKQWGCFRSFPRSVHKYGFFSGLFHYGGNIIHSFGTGVLSSTVSWPLGLTAGLWTQLWGIKYGEFKGAPVRSYVYQGCSFACYIIGAAFIVFR